MSIFADKLKKIQRIQSFDVKAEEEKQNKSRLSGGCFYPRGEIVLHCWHRRQSTQGLNIQTLGQLPRPAGRQATTHGQQRRHEILKLDTTPHCNYIIMS